MALVTCPECGKPDVSSTATSCPYCGYNLKRHFDGSEAMAAQVSEQVEVIKQQQAATAAKAKKSHPLLTMLLLAIGIWILVMILWNNMPSRKYKYTCYYCGKGIDAYYLHDNHYTCYSCHKLLE
ncbi:MAG: hypothetical protein IJ662_03460 [Clostridia bacterium]|nr:hypothetical protein [Clostridia bacterium]